MSDDLAAILGGSPSSAAPAKTYDPLDAALRTVYAEAPPNASPDELKAIASVIANRAKKSGKDVGAVVQEPGQFEPWGSDTGRKRIDGLDPAGPDYAKLKSTVGDILVGKADPTTDATLFYNPDAQKKLAPVDGRPERPAWDDGSGKQIGSHLFFSPGGGDDLASALGGSPPTRGPQPDDAQAAFAKQFGDLARFDGNGAAALTAEHMIDPLSGAEAAARMSKPQQDARDLMLKGGGLKGDAAAGSIYHPYFLGSDDKPEQGPPGSYYVDQKGHMGRVPGGPKDSSFLAGLGQGAADVATTGMSLLPKFGSDSEIYDDLKAMQMRYGAQYGGDLKSGLGRFTGQVAASGPVLGAGEVGLAPVLRTMGPVGEFIAGRAGATAAPRAAGAVARLQQIGLRGASLATSGAGEGAAAAGLVSSADDRPVGEQMASGAAFGGVLKPVAPLVVNGIRRFTGGSDLAGAASHAAQQDVVDKAGGLPVPVPLSLGQITESPAQQLVENATLKGVHGDAAQGVVKSFVGDQQGALKANVQAIADSMAGSAAEPGAGGRVVSDRLNAMRDTTKKAVDAAYDAARATGDNAMLPNSKDLRDAALEGLRKGYDLESVPDVARAVEGFGANGVPTARELFDFRTKISNLTQSNDGVQAGAAKAVRSVVDGYIDSALKHDLFIGDPDAVKAWKEAVGKRAEMGRLFQGGDLIEDLTEQVSRGGGRTLKVDPEEATNYIFGLSNLGFKKNLGRDLTRLRDVMGKDSDEWNALRADAFMRLARAGRGGTEAGEQQFSGANFLKAWNKAKGDNPQVIGVLFTPEERKLVDDFAEIAQRVTSPVKGGDNSSNSAFAAKKLMEPVLRFLSVGGGAGGGALLGGAPGAAVGATMGGVLKGLKEVVAAGKARKFTYGAKPVSDEPSLGAKLLAPAPGVVGGVLSNSLTGTH